jgi:hypothetical protein
VATSAPLAMKLEGAEKHMGTSSRLNIRVSSAY